MGHSGRLQIRVLGELHLAQADGRPAALPPSRKTRALLAYLAATGRPHRREHLCDLFWDGPDDPRAELRWSLSKIRALLNADGVVRLAADRERVAFDAARIDSDLAALRDLLGRGVDAASIDELKSAVALFHGEFLDGLDLPSCYRFQEWCLAEREALSALRLGALGALVHRLSDRPEQALAYARGLAAADPLSEPAHAAVVRLLAALGRRKDALAHYERARRVLESELGGPLSGELERARVLVSSGVTPAATPSPVRAGAPAATAPDNRERSTGGRTPVVAFVGRQHERALVDRLVSATADRRGSSVLLVTGEPGIGKSRLLDHLRQRTIATGGLALEGRAFEAETMRPYGVWTDLLRGVVRDRASDEWRALAPLFPELGASTDARATRSTLYDGVVRLLAHLAAGAPLAIAIDDLQWVDEASLSLLHYVARTLDARSGVLIACAGRAGELDDNAAASRLLRSLDQDARLERVALSPLSADDTAALVRTVDARVDPSLVFARSEGNPLFTLELARAHGRGHDPGADPGPTIDLVIAGQLARLKDRSRELITLAAALGRAFTLDLLARVAALDTSELLGALDDLERRGVVSPAGDAGYDFVHDLVRQAAYHSLSQPRRKLLHRSIARDLASRVEADDGVAGDLARHAALCDAHDLASRACAIAGGRCLRVFANAEAGAFAQRGLWHLERLPAGRDPRSAPAIETRIDLLKVRILAAAGPDMRPLPPLADDVSGAVASAEALGLHRAAATGHYLLSVLHQEAGHSEQAHQSTLRAAAVGRTADRDTRARQLANTARCLIEIETDVARGRALMHEAAALADPLGLEICELHWARGLLARWDGESAAAADAIARALALARTAGDRWREYKCLTWLAMIELERSRYDATGARCAELIEVARKLGQDDVPVIVALDALSRACAGDDLPADGLATALDALRAVDDKFYLAYALNAASAMHLRRGDADRARACATEALAAAALVQRRNETIVARALLARCRADNEIEATGAADDLLRECAGETCVSARARSAAREAAAPPGAHSHDRSHASRAE